MCIFSDNEVAAKRGLRFTCIMLLATFLTARGQDKPPVSRRLLTAADFKGNPDPRSDYLATTFTHLTYQYRRQTSCGEKDKIRFQFETSITVGDKSWMKWDKIRSKQLLRELLDHEQGHYDIAVAFADKLQKTLSSTCFNRNGFARQIDSVYKSVNSYYDTLQARYDAQTDHGQNREIQAKWKTRIAALR